MAFCYLHVVSRWLARVILPELILDRSGVGMIILCMTNRYCHCMDCIRGLVKIRNQGVKTLHVEPDIEAEIRLVYRRARYRRFAMLAITMSMGCSGLLIASNVFGTYLGFNAAPVAAIWLVFAIMLIIAATVAFAFEIRLSLHALGLAVEHMPRGETLRKRLEQGRGEK